MLDRRIALGFREGNPDAVRTVFREYGGLVFAVAFKVLGDRGLAEEATQETFVRAWRAAASYDPTRDLGPWLATISRRTSIDVFRRENRRRHQGLDQVMPSHPSLVELPPSAERAHEVWEVRRAIADLPADEREVVRLQHLEGLTHAEIADRLDLPVGTVKSRSFRAHRRLASSLGHLNDRDDEPAQTGGRNLRRRA